MVSTKHERVKGKAYYYAHNSRNVAGVRYGDTLRSDRSRAGILKRAGAIAWDAGVIERAVADGITRLMVKINGGSTYTTTIATLFAHGQISHGQAGRQWVLSLSSWSIDGGVRQAHPPAPEPVEGAPAAQLTLFDEVLS